MRLHHFHFVCLACCSTDVSRGLLADDLERFCAVCFAKQMRIVPLRRWPAIDGLTRSEAQEAHKERAP